MVFLKKTKKKKKENHDPQPQRVTTEKTITRV